MSDALLLVVTTASDTSTPSDGDLSLREAVDIANANPGSVITFDASLSGQTITLSGTELTLSSDVTISGDTNGDGKADITLNGGATFGGPNGVTGGSRIFNVDDGTATLNSLTLTGGNSDLGGAVFVNEGAALNLNNSTVTGNFAFVGNFGFGGGIANYGTLNVTNSTIAENFATAFGGGLFNAGDATLTNVAIVGNVGASQGGGILSFASMTVIDSTIANNNANTGGGAATSFFVDPTTVIIDLQNTIVVGNTASTVFPETEGGATPDANSIVGGDPTAVYPGGTAVLSDTGGVVDIVPLQNGVTAGSTTAVGAVNIAPVTVSDSATTSSPTSVLVDVLGNDLDVENDPLTLIAVGQGTNGSVVIESNQARYTPNANFTGDDTFSYTVSDGQGGTATGHVTVTVEGPVNDAPVAVDDAGQTDEDTPLSVAAGAGVLANDSDADGDSLSAVLVSDVSNGTLVLNADGSYTYTPDADFNGTDSFTYVASDGTENSAPATVTLTVNAVNDAPGFVGLVPAFSVPENSTAVTTLVGTDADASDTLSFSITGGDDAAAFALDEATGVLTFDPAPNFEVPTDANGNNVYEVAVGVSDGTLTTTQTLSVTVTDVDEAAAALVSVTAPADQAEGDSGTTPAAFTVSRTGDISQAVTVGLAFAGSASAADFTGSVTQVTLAAGVASVPVPLSILGETLLEPDETIAVTITSLSRTDHAIETGAATYTILNDDAAPVAGDDTLSTDEDTVLALDLLGNDTDADLDAVTITELRDSTGAVIPFGVATSLPEGGVVTIAADGTGSFDPAGAFEALDDGAVAVPAITLTYDITDGQGGTDSASVTIGIDGVNDAPVAVDDAGQTDEDTPLSVAAGAGVLANDSDADGDSLSAVLVSDVSNGTLVLNADGSYTYTPDADFNGTDSFTYVASDGTENSAPATVTLTVNAVNDAPGFVGLVPAFSVPENSTAVTTLVGTDADASDTLSFSITGGDDAAAFALDEATGVLTFDPAPNFEVPTDANGNNVYEVAVGVSDGTLTTTQTLSVTVTDVDEAAAALVSVTAPADQAEGDSGTTPAAFTVSRTGDISQAVTVGLAFAGSASAADFTGSVTQVTLAAGVASVPVPLSILGETLLEPDETIAVTITSLSRTDHAIETGAATYTILNDDAAPVAGDDTLSTDEDTVLALDLLGNDTDADLDAVTITELRDSTGAVIPFGVATSLPEGGVVTIAADGTGSFDPAGAFEALDDGAVAVPAITLTYDITDGQGGTDSASVTIGIDGVNDAPVAVDDAGQTDEDTPLSVAAGAGVLANDSDADGDSLSAVLVSDVSNGTLVLNADGSYTYTPDADFNGTDSFTYVASDGTENSAPATVTLTVNAVNDAPGFVGLVPAFSVPENSTAVTTLVGTDADASDTLSFSITGGDDAAAFALDEATGVLTFDPAPNFEVPTDANGNNVYEVAVGVSDGTLTTTQTLSVTVTDVDEAAAALVSVTAPADQAEGDSGTTPAAFTVSRTGDISQAVTVGLAFAGSASAADFTGSVTQVTLAAGVASVPVPLSILGETLLEPDETIAVTITSLSRTDHAIETGAATYTILNDDAAPVAGDDTLSTDEDTVLALDLLGNDTDADLDAVTITELRDSTGAVIPFGVATSLPEGGVVTIAADGTGSFDPAGAFEALDDGAVAVPAITLTYDITDGQGGTDSASVTIGIDGVNDAPVAVDDAGQTDEDTPLSVAAGAGVLANDSDADGDSLSAVLVSDVSNGTLVLNADGSYTYTPDADFNGTDSFTYVASDGTENSAPATVTLTVNAVNDAPGFVGLVPAFSVPENSTAVTTLVGTDADASDTLSFSITGGDDAAAFALDEATGVLTFDPAPNFEVPTDANGNNVYEVAVGVSDGTLTTTQTLSVTVTDVDEAAAALVSVTAPADQAEGDSGTTPAAFTVSRTGDISQAVTVGLAFAGSASAADFTGSVTQVTLAAGVASVPVPLSILGETLLEPDETIAVTITSLSRTDHAIETGAATYTILNDDAAPVAGDDTLSTDEDTVLALDLLGNDTDADLDAVTITELRDSTGAVIPFGVATSLPEGGVVTIAADGTGSFDPAGAFEALDDGAVAVPAITLTYDITDGQGGTDSASVTIGIDGVNDAPVAVDDAGQTDEDTPLSVAAGAGVLANDSDADGDSLSAVLVSDVSNGTLVLNADGSYTYTPDADFNGTDSFTYVASDGTENSAPATVTLTVNAVNDAPGFVGLVPAFSVPENSTAVTTLVGTDADASDTLSFSITGGDDAAAFALDEATGVLTFDPAPNFEVPTDANGNNVYEVAVGVSDGTLTTTQTLSVTVTDVDEAAAALVSVTAPADQAEGDSGTTPAAFTVSRTGDISQAVTVGLAFAGSASAADFTGSVTQVTLAAGVASVPVPLSILGETLLEPDETIAVTITSLSRTDHAIETGAATYTILNDDAAPVAGDDTLSTDEDTVLALDLLGNDTDADLDAVTITELRDSTGAVIPFGVATSLPEGGVVTIAADGTGSFDPAGAFEALDDGAVAVPAITLTYDITDGQGGTDSASVTIGIDGVNDAPVAVDDAGQTDEDTPLSVAAGAGVLANDSDADGDSLSAVLVSDVSNGTLVLNADGSYTYTPDADFNGTDSFTYVASDGTENSAPATVTLTVNAVNDAPGFVGLVPAFSVPENSTAVTTLVGTDADASDTLSFSITGGDDAAAFALDEATGVLTFDPAPNFEVPTDANGNNVYEVAVGVSDGTLTTTQTLSVTVTDVDEAAAALVSVTAPADQAEGDSGTTPAAFTVSRTGDISQAVTVGLAFAGSASAADFTGSVTQVTLAAGVASVPVPLSILGETLLEPDETIAVTITSLSRTDHAIETGAATYTILNDDAAPVAGDDTLSTDEDTVLALDLLGNDTDADLDAVTITELRDSTGAVIPFGVATSLPEGGVVTIAADGTGSFDPAGAFEALDDGAVAVPAITLTYDITDGQGGTDSASVTIGIDGVNDAPVAVDDAGQTDEDTPLSVAAGAGVLANDSDADGDSLSAVLVSDVSNGTLVLNADGSYTYTPDADFNGTDSFTYVASDGTENSAPATVTLTVNAVNDAPGFVGLVPAFSVPENSTAVTTLVGTDADASDTLSFSITGGDDAAAFALDEATGVLTFDPAPNFEVPTDANGNNVYEVAVGVSDGTLTTTQTLSVTVTDVDEAAAALVSVTAPADQAEGDSGTTPAAFTVSRTGDISQAVTVGLAFAGSASAADFTGSVTQVTLAAGVASVPVPLSILGETLLEPDETIAVTITSLSRTDHAIETGAATYTILNDDAAPVAGDDTLSTDEDTVLALDLLGNDTDADLDAVTITELRDSTGAVIPFGVATSLPEGGVVTIAADGTGSFDPAGAFEALDDGAVAVPAITLTYDITDGQGGTDSASVTIGIDGVNDAPVAVDDAGQTDEDTPLSVAAGAGVLANDSDADGDSLSAVLVSDVSNGTLVLNADGSYTYTPDADFNGTDSFTYVASDGTENSAPATVTLTVNAVNDAPGFVGLVPAFSVPENSTAVTTLVGTDADASDTLSFSITGGDDAAAFALDEATGVLTFDPAPNFEVPTDANGNNVYEVAVGVSDGTLTTTQTLSVTVTDVDEAAAALVSVTAPADQAEGDSGTTPAAFTVSRTGDISQAVTVGLAFAGSASAADFTGSVTQVTLAAGVASVPVPLSILGETLLEPDETIAVTITSLSRTDHAIETGAATYTILNDDAAPVAGDDTLSTDEDTVLALDLLGNDTDADLDAVTITELRDSTGAVIPFGVATSLPEGGVVTIAADGTGSFDPAGAFEALDDGAVAVPAITLTYDITDGQGGTDSASVTIGIDGVNDAPVAVDDAGQTDEDTPLSVAAGAGVLANDSDADGDSLSAVLVSDVSNGTLVLNADGSYTYTPDADFNGTDSFTYVASDGTENSAPATVTLTVNAVNDAPGFVGLVPAFSVPENSTAVTTLVGTDADASDTLSFSITGGDDAAAFALDEATGVLTFDPAPNFEVPTDANGNNVYEVAVGVSDGTLTTTQTLSVTVTDVDEAAAALVSVTAPADQAEGDSGTTPAAFTVSRTGDISQAVTVGLAFAGSASAADFTGSVTQVTLAAGVASVPVPLSILGETLLEPDETIAVTITSLSRTDHAIETGAATYTILNDDAAPVAGDDTLSTDEDTVLALDLLGNDTDADLDAVTITELRDSTGAVIPFGVATSLPEGGVVTIAADGTGSFDPAGAFEALDDGAVAVPAITLTYDITDGQGGTDSASVTIGIDGVNDAPVAVDDAGQTDEDTPLSVAAGAGVLANDSDADGDSLSAVLVSDVSNGTLVLNADGSYTYTPDADFNGTDSFTYVASDGTENSAPATVTLTVNAVNDAPVFTSPDFATVVEGDATFSFTAAIFDPDEDDTPVFQALSGLDADAFDFDPDNGTLVFANTPDFELPADEDGDNLYEVILAASDGDTVTTQALRIEVLEDTDDDGIANIADNAIFRFNPDQIDTDGDNYGNVIDADFNGDLFVDFLDVSAFSARFGTDDADADFNGDGVVDFLDVSTLSSLFGTNLEGQSFIDL